MDCLRQRSPGMSTRPRSREVWECGASLTQSAQAVLIPERSVVGRWRGQVCSGRGRYTSRLMPEVVHASVREVIRSGQEHTGQTGAQYRRVAFASGEPGASEWDGAGSPAPGIEPCASWSAGGDFGFEPGEQCVWACDADASNGFMSTRRMPPRVSWGETERGMTDFSWG